MSNLEIRFAARQDVPVIAKFIRDLAEYERLSDACLVQENQLEETLFGDRPYAEVLLAYTAGVPAGFALFFHNYSTFLGKPGIYLEDLFVEPVHRGKGFGKALLLKIVELAVQRDCGRVEWSVLDWNTPSINFYESLGARAQSDWNVYRLREDQFEKLLSGESSVG